jgi:hypothetical protein
MVRINPYSGAIIESKSYDTHASGTHSDNLANWIKSLPSWEVVLAGCYDEYQLSFNTNAHNWLQKIGMSIDYNTAKNGYRDSYALIGGRSLEAHGLAKDTFVK